MAEAVKKEEVKPKGPIGKLKELSEDKEEQLSLIHISEPTRPY